MSRSLVPLFLILCPAPIQAQSPVQDTRSEALIANARKMVAVDADGCLINDNPNEIVVCARADPNRQHRLPFPELARIPGERVRDPLPDANAEIVQQGRCYVTFNERNCFKGLPLMNLSFGGEGGGVGGPAGKLWSVIQPEVPDKDYVEQARIKPLDKTP